MQAVQRPMLRYHGGKWILAPWIISHMPKHRIYVEPFGGGASVLLRKHRSYAEIYNDLDGELVNLFRVARDSGDELRRALELTPFARDEFVESYEPTEDVVEQARRTVVRSFMGFGSNSHNKVTGFRSNSNRRGTTPAHDWRNYPGAFPGIIDRLQGVCIENRDAKLVSQTHDGKKTVHYLDPPYKWGTRDKGTDYRHEMDDSQHRDFGTWANALEGTVIVSGYPDPAYDEMFAGWNRIERAAHADGARDRVEVLWINRRKTTDLFT